MYIPGWFLIGILAYLFYPKETRALGGWLLTACAYIAIYALMWVPSLFLIYCHPWASIALVIVAVVTGMMDKRQARVTNG